MTIGRRWILCLDSFCTPLCLSRHAACSLARLVLCCETLHWPLFYPNACVKSLYHWLFILPVIKRFISNFVLSYLKGLILYLGFAEHLQRSMVKLLLYLSKSAHEERLQQPKPLYYWKDEYIYFLLFGTLTIHYLPVGVTLAFFCSIYSVCFSTMFHFS